MRRPKRVALVVAVLMLAASTALADYYLDDGTLVQWNGTNNTVDLLRPDGTTDTVPAEENRNGRLVPTNGLTDTQQTQVGLLPPQTVGGDSTFTENQAVSVPVFDQNGTFKGYGNLYTDAATGGGHVYMSDGTWVRDAYGQGSQYEWTGQSVIVTSPTQDTNPPPSSPETPTTTTTPPPTTTAPAPPPEPPCDPDPDYRRVTVTGPVGDVYAPTYIEIRVRISGGTLTGQPIVTTPWGTGYGVSDLGSGVWKSEIYVPTGYEGDQSINVAAYLTQYAGCGRTYRGYVNGRMTTTVTDIDRLQTQEADIVWPEEQGIPGTIMSLDQYTQNCLDPYAPGWCALSDHAALSLQEELRWDSGQTQELLGSDTYIELVRRIVRILNMNGLGDAIGVPLPEGYAVDDLLRMRPWNQ